MNASDLLRADLTVALFILGFIGACYLAWRFTFGADETWTLDDEGPQEIVRIGRGGLGDD